MSHDKPQTTEDALPWGEDQATDAALLREIEANRLWAEREARKAREKSQTTDRAMLEKVTDHLILLKRLASSPGAIRSNGKVVSKWQVVAMECQACHDKLMEHLNHASA